MPLDDKVRSGSKLPGGALLPLPMLGGGTTNVLIGAGYEYAATGASRPSTSPSWSAPGSMGASTQVGANSSYPNSQAPYVWSLHNGQALARAAHLRRLRDALGRIDDNAPVSAVLNSDRLSDARSLAGELLQALRTSGYDRADP